MSHILIAVSDETAPPHTRMQTIPTLPEPRLPLPIPGGPTPRTSPLATTFADGRVPPAYQPSERQREYQGYTRQMSPGQATRRDDQHRPRRGISQETIKDREDEEMMSEDVKPKGLSSLLN